MPLIAGIEPLGVAGPVGRRPDDAHVAAVPVATAITASKTATAFGASSLLDFCMPSTVRRRSRNGMGRAAHLSQRRYPFVARQPRRGSQASPTSSARAISERKTPPLRGCTDVS